MNGKGKRLWRGGQATIDKVLREIDTGSANGWVAQVPLLRAIDGRLQGILWIPFSGDSDCLKPAFDRVLQREIAIQHPKGNVRDRQDQ
jgi:hypothetical protein